MRTLGNFFVWVIALLAAGCAHNELRLRLDIYREDPAKPNFSKEQFHAYEQALDHARPAVESYAQERLAIGGAVRETYEAIVRLFPHDATPDPGVTNRNKYWSAYQEAVEGAKMDALNCIEAAKIAVENYQGILSRTDPLPEMDRVRARQDAIHRLDNAASSIRALASPLHTHFETSLLDNVDVMRKSLQEQFIKSISPNKNQALSDLRMKLEQLARRVEEASAQGSANLKGLAEQVAPPGLKTSEPSELSKALGTSLSALSTLPLAPSLPTNAQAVQATLATSADLNDIDRAQDPADPFWRALTDDGNATQWNPAFATNYFYAEGNSSVVVVRDTPISYRVQMGKNNPTALVEGQLAISRAVADAAIEIAGAASGVKLPVPTAKGASASAPEKTQASVDLAGQTAELDAKTALRRQAMVTLEARLRDLRKRIEQSPDDATRQTLLKELAGVLSGNALVFKPEDPKQTK